MVDEQEYQEEVDEQGVNFSDLIAALNRYKGQAALISLGIFVVGIVITFAWPTAYQSTATILLEEPEVPEMLVQTTVTTFAAEQIQYINQRVMTRTNLAQIIEKFDLYKDKRRYMPTLLLTDEVQSNMTLDLINVELTDPEAGRPVLKAIAFTVGFEDEKPDIAQQVANELVSLYMEENVRSRTVQTVETSAFLAGEVERMDDYVKQIEEKVALFKAEYEESLPEMLPINLQMSQRIDDQLMELKRRKTQINDTRILLKAQLSQIQPTQAMILPDGSAVLSSQDQLKSLQTRLAMLQGQYSDDHPDVLRTRRQIEAIQAETGLTADLTETTALLVDARSDLAKAKEEYSPDHPEVIRLQRMVDSLVNLVKEGRDSNDALIKPDNPAYIQLRSQLEALESDETALLVEERSLRAQLKDYENRMMQAPKVEQEMIALQRQLQSATTRYFAVRDRQFGAEMGEALETQSKGERFVLVEPPNLPLEPSTPNRPVLLVLFLVLAPAVGIGVIVLRMTLSQSIWGGRMLDSIQGGPPIAEIPVISTQREIKRSKLIMIASFAGVPAVLAILAVTIHFAIRPLDVLWFVMLRQLGI
jgi:succinoglycan biosynthesis transport protein ExoP